MTAGLLEILCGVIIGDEESRLFFIFVLVHGLRDSWGLNKRGFYCNSPPS